MTGLKEHIKQVIQEKLRSYKPESAHMPFHYRLLGRDRMALYSFIHSLNTAFGTSIFESVAVAIATPKYTRVKRKHSLGNQMTEEAAKEIEDIMRNISARKKDTSYTGKYKY